MGHLPYQSGYIYSNVTMYFLSGGLNVKVQPGSHHLHNHLTVELRYFEIDNAQLLPKKGLQIPYAVWKDILELHWSEVLDAFKDSALRPATWEYDIESSLKGARQKIRVSVTEFNTHVHLDFRVWIEANVGDFIPTTQGARLDFPTALKLKDLHDTKLQADQASFRDIKAAGKDYIYE